jgi:hypothetical protein
MQAIFFLSNTKMDKLVWLLEKVINKSFEANRLENNPWPI